MTEIIHRDRSSAPTTTEAFIADRQRFWSHFTRFTFYAVVVVVIGLILMAIFLG